MDTTIRKQTQTTYYLLVIKMIVFFYRSVVLMHSYSKFAFEVIHVATSHDLNLIATCIVNLVAYIFVDKAHSRLVFILLAILI